MSRKSNWSITNFYKQAWKITKENKKLWILGFAVALFASGGSNFNSSNFRESSQPESEEIQEQVLREQFDLTEEELAEMEETGMDLEQQMLLLQEAGADLEELQNEDLGLNSEEFPAAVMSQLGALNETTDKLGQFVAGLKQVNQEVYALLSIQIFIMVAIGFVLAWVASAWSRAALIKGVSVAAAKETVNLAEISTAALKRIKSVIYLDIVPGLKFFLKVLLALLGLIIVAAVMSGLIAVVAKQEAVAGLVILGLVIAAFLAFFYYFIKLLVSLLWSYRFCVLSKLGGKESFAKGKTTAVGNLRKTFRLGLTNILAGILIPLALFLPVIILVFRIVLKGDFFENLSPWSILPIIIALLITVPFVVVIGAAWQVFAYSTWHLGFKVLTKKSAS